MVAVYDFDHTIYRGDASMDFIIFCFMRHPKFLRYIPRYGIALVQYILGVKTRKQIKQVAFSFLNEIEDINHELVVFWTSHARKVEPWYKRQQRSDDVIISASPEFLLRPIVDRLGVKSLIGTRMDTNTGHISGENCRAVEKVKRFKNSNFFQPVEVAYSDSLSDMPLFKLAKRAYVVRRGVLTPLSSYRASHLSKLKSVKFIRFIIVGIVNAAIGVVLAYVVTRFIGLPVMSFIVGFMLSLVPSYILNSYVTFKDKELTIRKFYMFCVSYVPNFLVQLTTVFVLIGVLRFPVLLAYILSVIISVPVTFILVSVLAFKK